MPSFFSVYKKPTNLVLKGWDKWNKIIEKKDLERKQKASTKKFLL